MIKRKIYIPKSSDKYFTDSDVIYIVSLGGLNKNFIFKKLNYFHVNSIANQWRFLLCNLIKNDALNIVSKMYIEDIRLFFNVGDNDVNNPKGIIKYLDRYLANNKEITYKTLTIQDFVTKLLFHLPYKHFKMINRFGFYARVKSNKLKLALTFFKSIWGFDPFMCPNCNIYLEAYELFVSSAIGRTIHKFYNLNGLLFK